MVLTISSGEKIIAILGNEESMSAYSWKRLIGVGDSTIVCAVARGGGEIYEGQPFNRNAPNTRLIKVGDFPKLWKGLQITSGYKCHPWSLGVDTSADKFEATSKRGLTFEFEKE